MTTELNAIAFDINALLIEGESVLWEHEVDKQVLTKKAFPLKGILILIVGAILLSLPTPSFIPKQCNLLWIIFIETLCLFPLVWLCPFFYGFFTIKTSVFYYLTNLRLVAMQGNGLEVRSYFFQNWETLKANKKNQTLEFGSLTKPLVLYNVEAPEALQKLILEQLAKKQ
jgi:hypothetical protein